MRVVTVLAGVLLVAGCLQGSLPDSTLATGSSSNPGSPTPAVATASPSTSGSSTTRLMDSILVAFLNGTVAETGADYTYKGGVCGMALRANELWEGQMWYVASGNLTPGLVVLQGAHVQLMHDGGCGLQPYVLEFAQQGSVHVGSWGPTTVRRNGTVLEAGAAALGPQGSFTWAAAWDQTYTASSYEGRSGTYHYGGDVALVHAGMWAPERVHRVANCELLPHKCY